MNKIITLIEKKQIKKRIKFKTGDYINVKIWVIEGDKKRIQNFEGLVISIRNRGFHSSFTVRKISNGEGVERVFPTHSPIIESIIIKKMGTFRKSKLYYLRGKISKNFNIKTKI